ncbi:TPM domain-containing protein [Novilysobacter antarcticus]|uniref:TPM domain-containing protein n=1 Tax=Novilysobacter antarcticus TaxID=2862543 RepID=UPI001C98F937|nr:TPM domain-containing protein [Lysobacter antarcticus]
MRWLRHLFPPSSRRWFPDSLMQRIAAAIAAGEQRHSGELCFAVEPALRLRAVLAGASARDRARELFAQLGVWDTKNNNGVLLYLLLAEHRIELIADRGFDGRVEPAQWREACRVIEQHLQAGDPEAAITRGIEAISTLMAGAFPSIPGQRGENELPNEPHRL